MDGFVGTPGRTTAVGNKDPSIHQLRLFLALAEELHFGRAAQRMFISQPAFSRQITALERGLGVGLVQRSTRRVELTPTGRALLPEARAAVEAVDGLRRVVQRRAGRAHGRLRLGVIGTMAGAPCTRQVLAEFRRRHPESTVEMRSLDFVGQLDALASGEVDAAFLRPPLPAGIRTLQLAVERRIACLPADDPLLGRQPLLLEDLDDRVFVDVAGDTMRAWWDDWTVNPRPSGTRVRFGPAVTDIEPLLLAVAQGEGIAFLPAAARDLYPRPGLAYADVSGVSPATAALAWLPGSSTCPRVGALCDAARAVVGAAAAATGAANPGEARCRPDGHSARSAPRKQRSHYLQRTVPAPHRHRAGLREEHS